MASFHYIQLLCVSVSCDIIMFVNVMLKERKQKENIIPVEKEGGEGPNFSFAEEDEEDEEEDEEVEEEELPPLRRWDIILLYLL